MTDQQIIEALATRVMGWASVETTRGTEWIIERQDELIHMAFVDEWNPLNDWNHWRQVEEKFLKDWKLRNAYIVRVRVRSRLLHPTEAVMKADLPTRCKALITALDSLHS